MRSDYEQRCDPPPRCGCGCRVLHGKFLFHTTKGASSCPHESMPTQTRTRSKLVMVPEYAGPALTAGGDVPLGGAALFKVSLRNEISYFEKDRQGGAGYVPKDVVLSVDASSVEGGLQITANGAALARPGIPGVWFRFCGRVGRGPPRPDAVHIQSTEADPSGVAHYNIMGYYSLGNISLHPIPTVLLFFV